MTILAVPHPLLCMALDYLLIANKGKGWTILEIRKPLFSTFELSSRTLWREWPSSSCLRIDDLFNLSFLWSPFANRSLPALLVSSELLCSEAERLIPAAGNPASWVWFVCRGHVQTGCKRLRLEIKNWRLESK